MHVTKRVTVAYKGGERDEVQGRKWQVVCGVERMEMFPCCPIGGECGVSYTLEDVSL